MAADAELNAVLRELDMMRQNDPMHSMIPALEAYLSSRQDDALFDSLLDNAIQDPGSTSFLRLSPLSLYVTVFGVRMLVMIAFQAYKEKYVKDAPDNDDWKARFLKYADVSLQTANEMGRQVRLDVQRWDDEKQTVMHDLLREAITQDDEAKKTLMQAPDELTEDSLPDTYWGYPGNHAGLILSKIKSDLSDAPSGEASGTPLVETEDDTARPARRQRTC